MAAKKYEKILCAKCSKHIQGKYMIVEGENYHTECMSCENCKGSLEKHNQRTFCPKCYEDHVTKHSPKCAVCDEPIGLGRHIKAMGKDYHCKCFACVDCQQEIHEAEVYPINGKLYCYDCHWSGKLKAERARDKDSRNQDDRRNNKESQNQDSQRKRGKKGDRK